MLQLANFKWWRGAREGGRRERWRGRGRWGDCRRRGGGKSHSKNKLWNFPSSLTGRKQSINNDITRRREEKMEGINYWHYNSSPCLQTLQPHWLACSCCTHHYWLVKTIFSHHRQFYFCGHADNTLRGGINYSRCIHFKAQRVKIILFTLQTIRVKYIAHPEGTSRRRNMGQLALIFWDQCITRLLSIWGPCLAMLQSRVESAWRPCTNYWSVYCSAG